jgi:LysM repeat protein
MSETKRTQLCPICGAAQPLSARKCSICGAVLPGELTPIVPMPTVGEKPKRGQRARYDAATGEDDLFVGDLSGRMWRLVFVAGVVLALVLGLGLGLVVARLGSDDDPSSPQTERIGTPRATIPPTATPRRSLTPPMSDQGLFATQTPKPLIPLVTVTPMPPTPSETPTPGPCYQTAQTGDTVYGMAIRCGHVDMAVVDVILEINGLKSAEQLQLGQTLEIPWPTPTPGGEPPTTAPQDAGTGGNFATPQATAEVRVNEFGTPDALALYENVEATLRPGMAWHVVVAGDTIMGIAYQYDTTVELLSQINPQIPFLQCEYGERYGGPNCSVMLYEGQRMRVPVPIPTITPTPTPEFRTATPTPTPTFNAPYLLSPDHDAHFSADQMVTLRWGGTGTLNPGERYIVRVRDLNTGEIYTATVLETAYILPGGWQPADRDRHTFEWAISVGQVDAQFNILSEAHITEPRQFTWDSR